MSCHEKAWCRRFLFPWEKGGCTLEPSHGGQEWEERWWLAYVRETWRSGGEKVVQVKEKWSKKIEGHLGLERPFVGQHADGTSAHRHHLSWGRCHACHSWASSEALCACGSGDGGGCDLVDDDWIQLDPDHWSSDPMGSRRQRPLWVESGGGKLWGAAMKQVRRTETSERSLELVFVGSAVVAATISWEGGKPRRGM